MWWAGKDARLFGRTIYQNSRQTTDVQVLILRDKAVPDGFSSKDDF
jgi:hypothetical protein